MTLSTNLINFIISILTKALIIIQLSMLTTITICAVIIRVLTC